MPRLLLFIPLLLFIILGLFLWKGLSIDPRELPSALIGKPFPEFNLTEVNNPEQSLTKADFVGEPVLVNVWATWCPSCRQEHEQLLRMASSGKIKIIGLNYKDDRIAAQEWLQQLGNPYAMTIYDQDGMLGLDLGVYGAPETYLLDAHGIVRYRQVGVMTEQVWRDVQAMVKKGWADVKN